LQLRWHWRFFRVNHALGQLQYWKVGHFANCKTDSKKVLEALENDPNGSFEMSQVQEVLAGKEKEIVLIFVNSKPARGERRGSVTAGAKASPGAAVKGQKVAFFAPSAEEAQTWISALQQCAAASRAGGAGGGASAVHAPVVAAGGHKRPAAARSSVGGGGGGGGGLSAAFGGATGLVGGSSLYSSIAREGFQEALSTADTSDREKLVTTLHSLLQLICTSRAVEPDTLLKARARWAQERWQGHEDGKQEEEDGKQEGKWVEGKEEEEDEEKDDFEEKEGEEEGGGSHTTEGRRLLQAIALLLERVSGNRARVRKVPIPVDSNSGTNDQIGGDGDGVMSSAPEILGIDLPYASNETSGAGKAANGGTAPPGAAASGAGPLYVTCAPSSARVLDTVLTIFAWRGRLPEQGEVLFCRGDDAGGGGSRGTTEEDLEMLLRRWIDCRRFGMEGFVFVLAHCDALSFGMQSHLLDRIHQLQLEYKKYHTNNDGRVGGGGGGGGGGGASLLLLSGRPRVLLLNALAAHRVHIPLLPERTLRRWCSGAFTAHLGTTETVGSAINGGGKSSYIRSRAAQMQEQQARGGHAQYVRIPLREETTASALVQQLAGAQQEQQRREVHYMRGQQKQNASASPDAGPLVVHLDVRHVIPASANTLLFELLLLGCVRDDHPSSCLVYHRRRQDCFLIEIANSPDNGTARALRFASRFVPLNRLVVGPQQLNHTLVEAVDHGWPTGTKLQARAHDEMDVVCKVMQAYRGGRFRKRAAGEAPSAPKDGSPAVDYEPSFDPATAPSVSTAQCYELLFDQVCRGGAGGVDTRPSWALFHNFVAFMAAVVRQSKENPMVGYNCGGVLRTQHGLENLKHYLLKVLFVVDCTVNRLCYK
jgi:hypothetical protein